MKRWLFLLVGILGFIGSANATVITFDGNGVLSDEFPAGYTGIGDTYKQGGYTFTVGIGGHFDLMNADGIILHDSSNLGIPVDNYAYLSFSGGPFDLASFVFTLKPGDMITNLTPLTSYGVGIQEVNLNGLTWAAFSAVNLRVGGLPNEL